MPHAEIDLGTINPAQLERNSINRILLHYFKNTNPTSPGTCYSHQLVYAGSTYQGIHKTTYAGRTYKFRLTHTVTRRQRASNPLSYRYEIQSHKKLNPGSIATVHPVALTLAEDAFGYLKHSTRVRRVSKNFNLFGYSLAQSQQTKEFIEKESKIGQLDPNNGTKKAIHQPGKSLLFTRMVNGRELFDILNDDRDNTTPLTVMQRFDLFIQCLRALQRAHDYGIIHQDIKEENIIADVAANRVGIIDYGHSKECHETDPYEDPGTEYYLCPELIKKEPTNEKSDVYAMGIVGAGCFRINRVNYPGNNYDKNIVSEPTEDCQFYLNHFEKMSDIPEYIRLMIVDTLHKMTVAVRDNRLSVQDALETFEHIRMQFKLHQLHANNNHTQDGLLPHACATAIQARRHYRQLIREQKTPQQIEHDVFCFRVV